VNTVILIPIKEPSIAKSRLAGFLSRDERVRLAETMFEDVSRALLGTHARVTVVTSSEEAAQRARAHGWRVMWERLQISESASVDGASLQLSQEGVTSVLRLPADIPLLTAGDVERILMDCPPGPFAALVPSIDLLGTNALLRTPPGLFPSRFGYNSYVLHVQEAERAQARIRIAEIPTIALDLDEIPDLGRFLECPSDTRTFSYLRELAIGERLREREVR
jgi:2-phospho-L-lactate guanylyltransferase